MKNTEKIQDIAPAPEVEALRRFKWWQLVLAIVHLVSGALIIGYCAWFDINGDDEDGNKSWPIDVSVVYSVWVAPKGRSCGETDSGCAIFKQEKHFSKFDLGYAAGCFSVVSGLHHLLVFVALHQPPEGNLGAFYRRCLEASVFPWRWLDYAVTSGLMFAVTGGLFESPAPLDLVLFCFCFQFVVVVAGSGSECAWSATTGKERVALLDNGQREKIQEEYDNALGTQDAKEEEKSFYPKRLNDNTKEGGGTYLLNCFYYLFISLLSLVSLAINLWASFLCSISKVFETLSNTKKEDSWLRPMVSIENSYIKSLRLLTYRQNRTMWSTTSGVIFSSTFSVYVLVYMLFIYKFYLGVTAKDPGKGEEPNKDSCGVVMPTGINTPNDAVWIAILSIAITFTTFPVCHINKISLTEASNMMDTIKYETIYGFLSFTSKLILLFNIFAGIVMRSDSGIKPVDFRHPINNTEFEQGGTGVKHHDEDDWSASVVSIVVVIPSCLFLGIWSYYDTVLSNRIFKGLPASQEASVTSVIRSLIF